MALDFTSNASDGFGLGKMLGLDQLGKSAVGGEGTAMCGSRPTCFGNGKSCKEKQKNYSDCVQASIAAQRDAAIGVANAQASAQMRMAQLEADSQKMNPTLKKVLIVAGVIVGLIIVVKIIRR